MPDDESKRKPLIPGFTGGGADGGVGHLINDYKACPQCGKADMLTVRDYDLMWQDGEVWCTRCEVFVRRYDAG